MFIDAHPRLLTVDEVAARLALHPITVRRKIASGELPAVQLGGKGSAVRVDAAALQAWLYSEGDEACPA